MDKHYDELLIELECPICMTYMAPPIRQCVTGHSLCETCRRRLPACPLCQGKFTETKNISLEALARKMHYPCVNFKSGCVARLTLEERDNHERFCNFKAYKCFAPKCSWKGKYEGIIEHWSQKKLSSKAYNTDNVCHTKILKSEQYYVNLIQAYGELFWYRFKVTCGKLYWTVQYIGPTEKSNDFFFEIEILKPGQPIRRILMSEYCQPIDLDLNFKTGSCVLTTIEAVNHFIGQDDQLLIYYMRVKQAENERPRRDQNRSTGSVSSLVDRHFERSNGPKNQTFDTGRPRRDQSAPRATGAFHSLVDHDFGRRNDSNGPKKHFKQLRKPKNNN